MSHASYLVCHICLTLCVTGVLPGVSQVSYLVCHRCLTWCVTGVAHEAGGTGVLPGVSQVLPMKPAVQVQVKDESSPIQVASLLHGLEKHRPKRFSQFG